MRVVDLEDRLKKDLREMFALVDCHEPWTISDSKAYLMRLDQSQRLAAERLAHEKAKAFAAQHARAKAESGAKRRPPNRYSILTWSDRGYESGEGPTDYWR